MIASSMRAAGLSRSVRTERALFRGAALTMANPLYRESVDGFLAMMLAGDGVATDLTVAALDLRKHTAAKAEILAREPGVAAGLEEFAFLFRTAGVAVTPLVKDGDSFESGAVLAKLSGDQARLLSSERIGLNLLQRMCGIATAARSLQALAAGRNPETRVVGTRKTPWGLLDKRALHCGGVGTHRMSLSDAILIKNNHLKLIADREEEAAPAAILRAWRDRKDSAFIEVEVRSASAAVTAAETFGSLREQDDESYPCLVLLDNMAPPEIARVIETLRQERLWDHVLIEASGGVREANIEEYAASGADAISAGRLTHSARALDLCQRIS
jgi:nicotinate-nucleotide pyrophosphorylase (carboxylating)